MGGYFGAFNDSYLRSRDLSRREGQADLEEALTLDKVRQGALEQQDLGGLAGAFQERSRALAAGGGQPMPGGAALLPPPTPAPALAPDQRFGLEEAGVVPAQPSIQPTSAGPAGAPAGEGPRRKALLESIDPVMAGRLLRTQQGRSAIKDLETAEKEQELAEKKRLTAPLFTQAAELARSGDSLGYYDTVAKAMRIRGDHDSAGKHTEYSMKLRIDTKDRERSDGDLKRYAGLAAAYQADPSPDNQQKLLEGLSIANGTGSRPLQQQLIENNIKKIFNQDPRIMGFSKTISGGYRDAVVAGQEPNAEKIFREAATKDPEGFSAYVHDALTNHKQLPEVVLKKVLRWDVEDTKDIPKDVSQKAFVRTKAKYPDLKTNDPRFMEAWWQDEVRMTRELDKAKADGKATSPYEEARNLRGDVDAARKRLHDVRAELRNNRDPQKGTPDPARERDLLDEETAAKKNLDFYEGKMGKRAGLPAEPPKGPTPLAAQPPPTKAGRPLAASDPAYPGRVRKEFDALTADGQTPDQAAAELVRKGWDRGKVDEHRQTVPKAAPPAPGAEAPKPRPSISAAPVPQAASKWGLESKIYRDAAVAEMGRLGQAGYTREQAIAEMKRAGWK